MIGYPLVAGVAPVTVGVRELVTELWTPFHVELSGRFGVRAAVEALPRRRP